ncbi:hypothetical protein E5288_WYG000970 [Bos mutus]|uniref:Uncharacterized protein n=1 Tax=Bos mutus TaxID=72004 RepID=A0A6B0RX29_9CETA|nr:hypothetical protein [Bos mutus]
MLLSPPPEVYTSTPLFREALVCWGWNELGEYVCVFLHSCTLCKTQHPPFKAKAPGCPQQGLDMERGHHLQSLGEYTLAHTSALRAGDFLSLQMNLQLQHSVTVDCVDSVSQTEALMCQISCQGHETQWWILSKWLPVQDGVRTTQRELSGSVVECGVMERRKAAVPDHDWRHQEELSRGRDS